MSDDFQKGKIKRLIARTRRQVKDNEKAIKKLARGQQPYCSFCGRAAEEVEQLIAGNNAFICNLCVAMASETINEK